MWIKARTFILNTDNIVHISVNFDNDIHGKIPVEALLDFDADGDDISIIIATFNKKSDADRLVDEIFNALDNDKKTFNVNNFLADHGGILNVD